MIEHELTPEQWKKLEWEARVQRLEELLDQRAPVGHLDHARTMIQGSLLKRVATALSDDVESFNWEPEAFRAIWQVAQWIRENHPSFQAISVVLEKELER